MGVTMRMGLGAKGAKAATAMIGRILCVLALGVLMSGCDRCGDWWWAPDQTQSCKGKLPPSR
jgi:hypothetical protein